MEMRSGSALGEQEHPHGPFSITTDPLSSVDSCCERSGQNELRVVAERSFRVDSAPDTMVVHLKRFHVEERGQSYAMSKIGHDVGFPEELDFAACMDSVRCTGRSRAAVLFWGAQSRS